MRTFLLSAAGAFAALFAFNLLAFLFLLGTLGATLSSGGSEPEQSDSLVLTMDLRTPLSDLAPTSGLAAFSREQGFVDILTKLEAAADDPTVNGLFLRASQAGIGSARAEELRSAIIKLRDAGKFVIAHTQDSYSTGPSGYRAIAAADELWIQPGSTLLATGVTFETLFLGQLFDDLSIVPEIEAFYEYKNAPNTFTETDYTAPHREAMTALAESVWNVSLDSISSDRRIDREELKSLLESGPISSGEAVASGLMDRIGWPEDAQTEAISKNDDNSLLPISQYNPPFVGARAQQIAIVGGEGAIVTGVSDAGAFGGGNTFASDTVAQSILQAGRNSRVKAIVFRVDSPGGSPDASDQIWRSVERVQEMGKPVVISMGSAAASGGYYVSAGADYIFANPSTITGSIGIFGGKQTISGAMERIGIFPRTISVGGEFADAYGTDPFTEEQREQVITYLKRGYDRFTSIVAEGRGLSEDQIDDVARGRVWSGADALEVGLVDELGGFTDAIEKAKELADIATEEDVRLVFYPARKTGFEALEELFGASTEVARAASVIGTLAGDERLDDALTQMQLLQNERSQALGPILREH